MEGVGWAGVAEPPCRGKAERMSFCPEILLSGDLSGVAVTGHQERLSLGLFIPRVKMPCPGNSSLAPQQG